VSIGTAGGGIFSAKDVLRRNLGRKKNLREKGVHREGLSSMGAGDLALKEPND